MARNMRQQAGPPRATAHASLNINPLLLDEIVRRVNANEGLALARFTDGGFYCMQGHTGVNCDGVVYTPEQAASLMAALQNPLVTHCITSIALHRANAAAWLHEQGIHVAWHEGDTIHKASESGALWPLIAALRAKRIVMVGPRHLMRLGVFPVGSYFVEVHPTQAFETVDRIERDVCEAIKRNRADVVLISAGQGAAPTLTSRLAGSGVTVLDVGSIWDMYVGVLSRSGPKRMGRTFIEELGRRNFHMEVGSWWAI